jgi:hypothetical protein
VGGNLQALDELLGASERPVEHRSHANEQLAVHELADQPRIIGA